MKVAPVYIRIFIALLLVIMVLYVVVISSEEQPVSWEPTWSGTNDEPFGTEVLKHVASQLLAPAEMVVVKKSPSSLETDPEEVTSGRLAYLFINETFDPTEEEWEFLRDFAEQGNTLWVSASYLGSRVLDDIAVMVGSVHSSEFVHGEEEDSLAVNFRSESWPGGQFMIPQRYINGLLPEEEWGDVPEVLAESQGGTALAMSVPIGRGKMIVSAFPKIMSNYGLLTEAYSPLVTGMISFIPASTKRIYWDEWIKIGNRKRDRDRPSADTPGALTYLWQHEALRMALLLSLLGLILLAVFQSRRVQQIIPPSDPVTNATLEFTQTVGRLYFQHQNHAQLARKRVAAFRDHLSEQYLLSETWGTDAYARQLAAKSGRDPAQTHLLISTLVKAEHATQMNESQLQELSKQIDTFSHLSEDDPS